MKVVIVGAGVIGMMTARELSAARCEVVLLERGWVGQEASWAGGGIVSPLYPWRYPAPVTALASVAQQVYPSLTAELAQETGIDAELTQTGLLMLDADDGRDAEAWAVMNGHRLLRLRQPELRQQMPDLCPDWHSGLWMPAIANIRNPRLLKALRRSLESRGVAIHEQVEVVRWQRQGQSISAAISQEGKQFHADAFVICSGAWSRQVFESAAERGLMVRPVRGQMLLYKVQVGALKSMLMSQGRYLIPRRDGHVLCGSTLEEVGFDKSTTDEGMHSLRASAERLWPALTGQVPIAHWAGLRPGAPNGIPFIGRAPNCENLWVNAGQFRNGLVLAPASARLLADQLLQRKPQLDPLPYQLTVS